MFLGTFTLKNARSVFVVFRISTMSWLLKGYAACCKSVHQLYAFALFAKTPMSSFGDEATLGTTITPQTQKPRKSAWRKDVLARLASALQLGKLTLDDCHTEDII